MIKKSIFLGIAILTALSFNAVPAFGAGITIGSGTTLDVGTATLTVPGDITINGTLNGNQGIIQLTGNWSNLNIFNCGTGTIEFTGAGGTNQNILGDSHFYNFTCATSNTRSLSFEATKTQTIEAKLKLAGSDAANRLYLRSTASNLWIIYPYLYPSDLTGSREVTFVNVKNSYNKRGGLTASDFGKTTTFAINAVNSTDEASNTTIDWWLFGEDTSPPVVTVEAPNGGETWSSKATQTISFTCSDESGIASNSAIIYYTTGEGWIKIASGDAITLNPPNGSYNWLVPDTPTTEAKVRVTVRDASPNANIGTGESVSTFEITSSNFVVLNISRESDAVGGSINVNWTENVTPDVYVLFGDGTGKYATPETNWATVETPGISGSFEVHYAERFIRFKSSVRMGTPEAYFKALYQGSSKSLLPSAEAVGKFDILLSADTTNKKLYVISSPFILPDTSIATVLGNQFEGGGGTGFQDADYIYYLEPGQSTPQSYYTGSGWSGTLASLNADKGYVFIVQAGHPSRTITLVGTVAQTTRTNMLILKVGLVGLNLLGTTYPVQVNLQPDNTGLSSTTPSGPKAGTGFTDADYIYTFDPGSTPQSYYTGSGWSGTLDKLKPTKGYVYIKQDVGTETWNYPKPY